MSTQVYWLEQPWLLSADYVGDLTSEDMDAVLEQSLALAEEQPVYVLIDTRALNVRPSNIKTMSRLDTLRQLVSHPNLCWLAFVGTDPLARYYMTLLTPHKVRIFPLREQAITFLRDRVSLETSALVPMH